MDPCAWLTKFNNDNIIIQNETKRVYLPTTPFIQVEWVTQYLLKTYNGKVKVEVVNNRLTLTYNFLFARMEVVRSFHLYMYNRESLEEMIRFIRHKVISWCGSFQIKKVYCSIPVLSEGHCWKSVYTFKSYEFLVTPRERNIRNIFM